MTFAPLDLTFVVTPSNVRIFERNFAASPCLTNMPQDRVILQEGYHSASLAYNDAIDKAKSDLMVFAHQDVYFPDGWLCDLSHALQMLERFDPNWGALGGWGVTNRGVQAGYLYSTGLGVLGKPFTLPVPIDTLDEYFLILRKSSGLRFDPDLPNFNFYGTDICMSAREKRMRCYAISAFAIHNTSYGYAVGPSGFLEGYWYIRRRWKKFLPIQTSCIRVSRLNEDLLVRRLKRACSVILRKGLEVHPRLDDPRSALTAVADT